MCEQDSDVRSVLESAGLPVSPDPVRMQAVRQRMIGACEAGHPHRRRNRAIGAAGIVLIGSAALAIGGTRAGRDLVRWIFTPVQTPATVTGENASGNGMWVVSRSYYTGVSGADNSAEKKSGAAPAEAPAPEPFTAAEEQEIRARMAEVDAIQQAGGGRLVGLNDAPGFVPGETIHIVYSVEYTLASGKKTTVGQGVTGKQAANLRIAEINKLRDSGAGQLISHEPFPMGLGRYTIRFTLADGQTIDLETLYPPGPRQQREAIFAETRELRKALRFSVEHASAMGEGRVYGLLRYKLADGRIVGISEQIPPEAITPDGKYVVVPDSTPVGIEGATGK